MWRHTAGLGLASYRIVTEVNLWFRHYSFSWTFGYNHVLRMPPAFVECFDITVILFALYVQVASWLKSSGRLMLLMLVYVRSLFSLVIAYFDRFVSCTVWARILMMLSAVCVCYMCAAYMLHVRHSLVSLGGYSGWHPARTRCERPADWLRRRPAAHLVTRSCIIENPKSENFVRNPQYL